MALSLTDTFFTHSPDFAGYASDEIWVADHVWSLEEIVNLLK